MQIITRPGRLNLNVIHSNGSTAAASFPAATPSRIEFAMLREMRRLLPVWPCRNSLTEQQAFHAKADAQMGIATER